MKNFHSSKLSKAFSEVKSINRSIDRLYRLKRKILERTPKPFKEGQRVRVKKQFGGYKYYVINRVYAEADVLRRSIRFHVWGFRCTKAGDVRSGHGYLSVADWQSAEVVA